MNYLQNKRIRTRQGKLIVTLILLVLTFIIILTRLPVRSGGIFGTLAKPIWRVGNVLSDSVHSIGLFSKPKQTLISENQTLQEKILELNAQVAGFQILEKENQDLKQILERKPQGTRMVLAGVLAIPTRTPYDTVIIDAGSEEGIAKDQIVFAYSTIAIGTISEVYTHTSKVTLFSSPGVIFDGLLINDNTHIETKGNGGGNLEATLPREVSVEIGEVMVTPGTTGHTVATVGKIVSDPRDPFQKVILVSPINMNQLRFVEVQVAHN